MYVNVCAKWRRRQEGTRTHAMHMYRLYRILRSQAIHILIPLSHPFSFNSTLSLSLFFFSFLWLYFFFIPSSLSICAFRMRRHGPRILCRLRSLLSLRRDKKAHNTDDNWRHLSPVFPPLPVQAEDEEEDEDFEASIYREERMGRVYSFWVHAYLIMHVHAHC